MVVCREMFLVLVYLIAPKVLYPSLQFSPVALRGLPFVSVSGLSVRWNLMERFLRSTRVEPFFCRGLSHMFLATFP